ncbi:MAG: DsbC family protein [Pseudomonadota bacterium]
MKTLSLLALSLLALSAHADEAAIRKAFAERYPKAVIKSVSTTPVPGLYEVYAGGQMLYVDEKGDHLLMGPLVDTRSRSNLTQQRMDELNRVDFAKLPLDKAITIVKGKGERRIAVFSDPDCPFCKRLEKELAGMDNLTVYLFMLPLAELHPQAVGIAKDVWCAQDRAKAWQDYVLEGKKPAGGAACDTPVDAIAALAGELGINGTPAIILPNGRRLDGAVPAARIEAMLSGG